jgi:hypothetical protein
MKGKMIRLLLTRNQAQVLYDDFDNHIGSGSDIKEFAQVRAKLGRKLGGVHDDN